MLTSALRMAREYVRASGLLIEASTGNKSLRPWRLIAGLDAAAVQ